MQSGESERKLQEILPKSGLVVSEKGQLTEVHLSLILSSSPGRPSSASSCFGHSDVNAHPQVHVSEWISFQVFCKPKILPLKSVTLQKLEEMEKLMLDIAKQQPSS